MRKFIVGLLLFIMPIHLRYAHGADYSPCAYQPDYLVAIENKKHYFDAHPAEPEKETLLRRFEITFLISLPFVFICNFLVLHVSDAIVRRNLNVNVWSHHGPFLIANSLMMTSVIAYRETAIVEELQKKNRPAVSQKENRIYLGLSRRL